MIFFVEKLQLVSVDRSTLQQLHFGSFDFGHDFSGRTGVPVQFGNRDLFYKENFSIIKLSYIIPIPPTLQQFKHLDFNICVVIQSAMVTGPSLFIYCFCGKLATESFEKMAQCLYEANWHNTSVILQKYIIIMMSNTQQPLYYDGFGIVILNLKTFTSVSK